MKALAAAIVVVAMAGSGCMWGCDGRPWVTGAEWVEPGLFDAFPAPGRVGRYTVDAWQENEPFMEKGSTETAPPPGFDFGNVTAKGAHRADRTLRVFTAGRAFEGNETHWTFYAEHRLGQDETQAALLATFDDLGLPPPRQAPATFDWGSACG